jgi:PilZ domain-containing protein
MGVVMTEEKRRHGRVPVVLEALWDGSTGKSRARTTDVSEGGCFIDSLGHVAVGEILSLKLLAPSGEFITVEAEVIYEMPRFGFGVHFVNLSEDDRQRLKELLGSSD